MSTDDFHFFLIRKEPGDRQVPWQDRKGAISSDSKDENFSHEGVADVEAAALEEQAHGGDHISAELGGVSYGQRADGTALNHPDRAVTGIRHVHAAVLSHGHALGGGEGRLGRSAAGVTVAAASGQKGDFTVLELENPVFTGLGYVQDAVLPAQAHGVGQALDYGGQSAGDADPPHRPVEGIRDIQIPAAVCRQTRRAVEHYAKVCNRQFLRRRRVERADGFAAD